MRSPLLVLLIGLALAACSTTSGPGRPSFTQEGIASYYGRTHQGRITASGERFDMNGRTAAHRTLELGTVVRVTNLENGRTAKVRINDRGPYVRGRIIDLAQRVAKELDVIEDGTARVRLEVYASDQTGALEAAK
jgi:rare lipoprotein A